MISLINTMITPIIVFIIISNNLQTQLYPFNFQLLPFYICKNLS